MCFYNCILQSSFLVFCFGSCFCQDRSCLIRVCPYIHTVKICYTHRYIHVSLSDSFYYYNGEIKRSYVFQSKIKNTINSKDCKHGLKHHVHIMVDSVAKNHFLMAVHRKGKDNLPTYPSMRKNIELLYRPHLLH